MKYKGKRPTSKNNGSVIIEELTEEEFNCVMEETKLTYEHFERFNSWQKDKKLFEEKIKNEKNK